MKSSSTIAWFVFGAAAALLVGGCPAQGVAVGDEFDGRWLVTSEQLNTCVVITAGKIASIDENCSGQPILPRSAGEGTRAGNQVTWSVIALNTLGQFINLEFDVSVQADGSLVGIEVINDFSGAEPEIRDILMTRR
ncbi:MAG: hypothetical protein U1D55_03215 [Phycisphaerae bacterium]